MARIAIVTDSHGGAYVKRIKPLLEAEGHEVVFDRVQSGWSTNSYLKKAPELENQLRKARPNVVIFGLGGNNVRFKPEVYGEELKRMVGMGMSSGARKLFWMGPAVSDPDATTDEKKRKIAASTAVRHEKTAELQKAILPRYGVKWIDIRPITKTGHRSDGVHFTGSAYTRWAQYAANKINSSLRGMGFRNLPALPFTVPTPTWWVSLPKPVKLAGGVVLALIVAFMIRTGRERRTRRQYPSKRRL